MRILVIGGTRDHLGGVEAFCDRAKISMERICPELRIERLWTSTAYLSLRRLPAFVLGVLRLIASRARGNAVAWIQYVNLPDLIYVLLAKALGYETVVTPHLGLNWKSQRNSTLRTISRLILSRADRIALLSQTQESEISLPSNVQRSLIRTFLPPEVLEPISVPANTDKSELPSGELRLIHASRLSVAKGTFLMLDVCARLQAAGVTFSAQIVGSADEETRISLRKSIEEKNLSEHVSLLGWATPEQLMGQLRNADVLVHLSQVDSYPLIVLEALASGTLPLALDLAGARSMISDYDGFLVSRLQPVEDAVTHLTTCTLADIRSRAAAHAGQVRADFAWPTAATLLLESLQPTRSPT
ncbi:glycosyltransferase involved in cell wall biosynthesis [Bradyrhizobium japonicum]|uniref:Glycosyltransferase involved in cell wall biosynthesis n=1 Tax=Bradyrhizobium japonicum TaxID=375 RepID=A0ABV2RH40_BRAJP|nr:glycosyltransferase [Bradyrhizobium japonicum]MBR0735202.1 glycosyltransferase [Bradyrhizobium japonicum]